MATLVRAFAEIAQHLNEAGYSDADAAKVQREVEFYSEIRSAIKKHSGEELDIKPYEADMRHLLNTYVQADPATGLGNLDSLMHTYGSVLLFLTCRFHGGLVFPARM